MKFSDLSLIYTVFQIFDYKFLLSSYGDIEQQEVLEGFKIIQATSEIKYLS